MQNKIELSPVKKIIPFQLGKGMIDSHDPRLWTKFVTAFINEVSAQELASVFDTSINTTKSRIDLSHMFISNYEELEEARSKALILQRTAIDFKSETPGNRFKRLVNEMEAIQNSDDKQRETYLSHKKTITNFDKVCKDLNEKSSKVLAILKPYLGPSALHIVTEKESEYNTNNKKFEHRAKLLDVMDALQSNFGMSTDEAERQITDEFRLIGYANSIEGDIGSLGSLISQFNNHIIERQALNLVPLDNQYLLNELIARINLDEPLAKHDTTTFDLFKQFQHTIQTTKPKFTEVFSIYKKASIEKAFKHSFKSFDTNTSTSSSNDHNYPSLLSSSSSSNFVGLSMKSVNENSKAICFRYQNQGTCFHGDNCKYAHITKSTGSKWGGSNSNRSDQPSKPICYQYAKGECRYGDKCKYYHDVSTQLGTKEVCQDFKKYKSCRFGDRCRYSHNDNSNKRKLDSPQTTPPSTPKSILKKHRPSTPIRPVDKEE